MKLQTRTSVPALALAILLVILAGACSSTSQVVTPPASEQSATTTTNNTPPSTTGDSTVKVVYFHPRVRCGACIYVEERTRYVIVTFFQDKIDSSELVFEIYDLGEKQNAGIANKYQVVGSQLFINAIIGGVDHIDHIENVWMPKYLNDQEAFDKLIQNLIQQSLKKVQ